MDLSRDQIVRYSRQLLLKEMTKERQLRLLSSSVLVIGAGGLGSIVLPYLAGSGVGRIGVVEFDRVELSNLPRQILYDTGDIGRMKVDVVKDRLINMNPDIKVEVHNIRLGEDNSEAIIDKYDLIVDCTDNFETRFAINRMAIKYNRPLISGAVTRFEGNVMLIVPKKTFCYSCVFEEADGFCAITCANAGVLGSVVGVIGSIMSQEAIKFLIGIPTIEGNLIIYDGLKTAIRKVKVNKNPRCKVCS